VTAPAYRVEPGEAARDRDALIAIWRGNLGRDDRMRAKFDWFYLGCPFGEPVVRVLRHGEQALPVGVATAARRPMRWNGQALRAGVLVDLAVVAEHRALGPALMLQGSLLQDGATHFDLLYGFPNQKAVPAFKRSGYRHLGDIVRYARVIRHSGYLGDRLPSVLTAPAGVVLDIGRRVLDGWKRLGARRLQAQWSDHADARFDALWARSGEADGLVAVHDQAFARWRFDDSPLERTRYLLLTDPADGQLCAWFACQVQGKVLHVRDFWADDARTGLGYGYVDALVTNARRAGHVAVSMEYAAAPDKLAGWLAAGFVERGRRPVYGRFLDGVERDLGQWHLTAADEDE
jgi:hypothetical protein